MGETPLRQTVRLVKEWSQLPKIGAVKGTETLTDRVWTIAELLNSAGV
jgi:hypothetical protein